MKSTDAQVQVKKKSQLADIWRRLKKNKLALLGLAILFFFFLVMIFADFIVDYRQCIAQNVPNKLKAPSSEHWFGTDSLGRDILARVIHGSRLSLSIGFIVVGLALLIGGAIGAIAGYFEGRVDTILMRIMEVFMATPSMLLSISIVSALGPGMKNLLLAITVSSIPRFAVIVRSSILSIRNAEFVEAAIAAGASPARIITRHILPNSLGPIIVQATLSMGGVILTASSLSFIGLGVMAPQPEWGAILNEGREFIRKAPWLVVFPGSAIMLAVLALNLLGDGLRDALDPRLK